MDRRTRGYIRQLRAAATDYIHTSTIRRGRSLEILTSFRSGETNSESQPWMVLGLFPIDPIIAQSCRLASGGKTSAGTRGPHYWRPSRKGIGNN